MNSAKFHYYRWEPLRWRISETRGRCLALPKGFEAMAALGVYRELIDYCFIEGSIPSDIGGLAAVVGCPVEIMEAVWPAIKGKFSQKRRHPERLICDNVEMRKTRAGELSRTNSVNRLHGWSKSGFTKSHGDNNLDDGRIDVGYEPDSINKKLEIRNKKLEKKKEASPPKKAAPKVAATPSEIVAKLQSEPAYTSLNVQHEFDKCGAWCRANHEQLTEKRFVNWLNRADKPMFSNGNGSIPIKVHDAGPYLPEFKGYK
jgi:hypothetical protein